MIEKIKDLWRILRFAALADKFIKISEIRGKYYERF